MLLNGVLAQPPATGGHAGGAIVLTLGQPREGPGYARAPLARCLGRGRWRHDATRSSQPSGSTPSHGEFPGPCDAGSLRRGLTGQTPSRRRAAAYGDERRPEPWRRGRRHYCPQRPAQQTSQPVPPVQSELSRQWCGTHHLGPAPIAFATHVWMKRSLAGSASILCAASAQAICASISHRFAKLKRAAPASLCSVAFALHVWSAATVPLMIKPQSTKIRARGCIRSSRSRKPWLGSNLERPSRS